MISSLKLNVDFRGVLSKNSHRKPPETILAILVAWLIKPIGSFWKNLEFLPAPFKRLGKIKSTGFSELSILLLTIFILFLIFILYI